MILWVDAQLSPQLAPWITEICGAEAHALSELGMVGASDKGIYEAAREIGAVIVTKDSDFPRLLERMGSPPQIVWITCGNTSNARLKQVLRTALPTALELGEPLVEISDAQ